MERPRPSASTAPSTWYAEVAAPHRKPGGNTPRCGPFVVTDASPSDPTVCRRYHGKPVTDHRSNAPSYRALLEVPTLGRALLSMQLARVAQSMVSVAIVLFALAEYQSAAVAGIVTVARLFPGIVLRPIAGALLDRHG